nr:hypothetical protein [Chitinophagaceae bacterium]
MTHRSIISATMKGIIALMFICQSLIAQIIPTTDKPTVIMFILHISSNKIESLEKKGMRKDAQLVREADREINTSIMRDFKENFKFCEVYFFYDSQMNYVLQKQWNMVTFYDSEHLKNGKKIEVSYIDNYIMAEVAYPPAPEYPRIDSTGKEIEPLYTTDYANARDYGIICYDQQYQLLRNKLQYTNISLRRVGNILRPESIQYRFVGAKKFQQKLERFFAPKVY